jgi:hypothetical protein
MKFPFSDSYSGNRQQTADLLKGLAVIFMIMIHLFENIASNSLTSSLIGKIIFFLGGPPAAPMFMIVMGFFLAGSKRTTSLMIKRGIALFFGGILLNVGLNASILLKIFFGEVTLNPLRFILGVDILPLAGLSIIAIALLKPLFRNFAEAYFILAVIIVQLNSLLISHFQVEVFPFNYLIAFIWGSYDWSYFSLLPWLSFPLIGYSLKLFFDGIGKTPNIKTIYITISLILFGLFFALTEEYALNITAILPVYYKFGITFFVWMLQFLAGYTFLIYVMEQKFSNNSLLIYIKWIGENVTVFYVFQWLLIGNISTYIFQTESNLFYMLVWFVAILLSTTILVLVWKSVTGKKKVVSS